MNLDMADTEQSVLNEMGETSVAVTTKGYEPTYEEAFPPLPAGMSDEAMNGTVGNLHSWNKLAVKPSRVTQVRTLSIIIILLFD